ncbi:NAD-dependent epimerase/dehydratase family protein [Isobaculum melis]|uniref:Nucleoside-diphosphate-sugar epimerase n=1 Tax=Isobaculum melis TaxID=142588 RepID=A0A1H9UDL2_9LACT|nr:NAD-dependent epimerase/dehydratase family protein [Isobaculum melis]SES07254.1 Nucleoside-diphosphate-sugar epimerase [Isobaculum melis]
MKQILVFGGSRFFGKKIVELLLAKGHQVTLANRGKTKDSFGSNVNRIKIDRTDSSHPNWQVLAGKDWDVVIDNICFTKEEAAITIQYLAGKVKQYLFTSSLAVYSGQGTGENGGYLEADFNPVTYQIDADKTVDYGEGKRQAEVAFTMSQAFPVTSLRIPIVLDDDDYTERLHQYVRAVQHHESIAVKNQQAKISFIKGSEVANVMNWLIEEQLEGPINASSCDTLTIEQFLAWLEVGVGILPIIEETTTSSKPMPFDIAKDWFLDTHFIQKKGFLEIGLASWVPTLIKRLNQS